MKRLIVASNVIVWLLLAGVLITYLLIWLFA